MCACQPTTTSKKGAIPLTIEGAVRNKRNTKMREEFERSLGMDSDTEYIEEDGALVNKVTHVQVFQAVRDLRQDYKHMGKFLLHLDDRITDQNGYKDELKLMQGTLESLCNDRTVTCPVFPIVNELKEDLEQHLAEEAKNELIATTAQKLKEQYLQEGKDEEAFRFKRAMGIIGAIATIITLFMAVITWLLDLWSF